MFATMLQKVCVFFIWFFWWQHCVGQQHCDHRFTGKVIDDHDDRPLVGAVVRLGDQTEVTNNEGFFSFQQVCDSTYHLVITHINCNPLEQLISLPQSRNKTFYLEHHSNLLENINILTLAKRGELAKASTTLSRKELNQKRGKGFGELLSNSRGVSLLKTGSTITKPVINGLHSQRVLLINNNMRMEGQQWGLEHAPEVDPYTVQTLSVIQGAGSVEYGADAIGGVILIEPALLPDKYGITINPSFILQSNSRSGKAALDLLGKHQLFGLPISYQAQGSIRKAGNLKSPQYYLDNSGQEEANFQLRAGFVGDEFGIEAKLSQYNNHLGILTDSHIGNKTDLIAIIENGKPFVDRGFSYNINRPRQEILHEIGQLKSYVHTRWGKLAIDVSRQYNRRSEYDRDDENPGLRLKTETFLGNISLQHQLVDRLKGRAGLQAINQKYKANGFYLIPEYNHSGFGAFLFEEYTFQKEFTLEAGLRYDQKNYTYYIPYKEFRRLDDREILYKEINEDIGTKTKHYRGLFTGSGGFSWTPSNHITISSYLGVAARQPLPNELYSDGVHHGTALWEVGNPNLMIEKSTNIQLNAIYSSSNSTIDINLFTNNIENYAYLIPNQQLNPINTIRGTFPVHEMNQSDVRMVGLNYSAKRDFDNKKWHFRTTGSLLRADDKQRNEPLIYMPANRFNHAIRFNVKSNTFLGLQMENVLTQRRVPEHIMDYTTPPKGYTLLHINANHETTFANNILDIGIGVENLGNTEYKDYLDRFRYFAHSPGLNMTLRLNYTIN